jgi:adenylate cyclase
MANDLTPEEWWRALLTGNARDMPIKPVRQIFARLNSTHRCKFCNSPFDGTWAPAMKLVGRNASRLSLHLCHQCQVVASEHLGGTEVDLTLLFADVRGSTKLGEQMNATEFSQLISRFFSVSSHILMHSGAWVDKLVGDQVIGIYVPYFVSNLQEHIALEAARALLHETGHDDPRGPWIQVGVGIHSGPTFVGTVGSPQGAADITVLGDVPNVAARLSSAAAAGEILISESVAKKSELPPTLEKRSLELKGKSEPMTVYVMNPSAASYPA